MSPHTSPTSCIVENITSRPQTSFAPKNPETGIILSDQWFLIYLVINLLPKYYK